MAASENFVALEFTDLYIRKAPDGSERRLIAKYRPRDAGRGVSELKDVPEGLYDDIEALFTMIGTAAKGRLEFSIPYPPLRFRVTTNPDVLYGDTYHLRRPMDKVPEIEAREFGLEPMLITPLMELGRATGLVAVVGGIGQGKTTTASALMHAWMRRYGDFGMVIEDAEELPLSDAFPGGMCIEVLVDGDDGWEPALKRALRSRPRFVFVGEIRSPAAAVQVLRMAESGQMVITTLHGGSIEEALEALNQLAARDIGETARSMLANGLTAVLHQSRGKSLDMTCLFVSPNLGDPARALIRQGNFAGLKSIVENQRARLVGA